MWGTCSLTDDVHDTGPSAPAAAIRAAAPQPVSIDSPADEQEQQLSLVDFANWRVFGHATFRHKQRTVINALMQVCSMAHSILLDCKFMAECLCCHGYLHFLQRR